MKVMSSSRNNEWNTRDVIKNDNHVSEIRVTSSKDDNYISEIRVTSSNLLFFDELQISTNDSFVRIFLVETVLDLDGVRRVLVRRMIVWRTNVVDITFWKKQRTEISVTSYSVFKSIKLWEKNREKRCDVIKVNKSIEFCPKQESN